VCWVTVRFRRVVVAGSVLTAAVGQFNVCL
jgi:hypothetical protein